MSVKPVNLSLSAQKNANLNEQKQNKSTIKQAPSFKGSFNPVVTLMDAIDRGGFAASFIAQDGIGMVAPRIYEGLNRNRKKDENGNLTGPLNWEFARREGIREILSGPSAFLIPMGIMAGIKRWSGTANNVHVSHINALGNSFSEFAKENHNLLANPREAKLEFYTRVFENSLSESTGKALTGDELQNTAKDFANTLIKIEEASTKKESKKLSNELVEKYMRLRKSHVAPSNNELEAQFLLKDGKNTLTTSFRRLTQSMTDYTNDALKAVGKEIEKTKDAKNIEEFINNFNHKRVGSRVLSILGMFSAVVGFYTIIPKLYNMGLKKDPGLAGLDGAENDAKQAENVDKKQDSKNQNTSATTNENNNGKDVAFKGGLSALGKGITEHKTAGNLINKFEFNGASMSVPAMLTLLFGFCLPPRYVNAKSDHEKREIIVRDVSSFTAILFGAKALARGFSDMFAKITGLALNTRPDDHNKSILHKAKNYFTAGTGIDVLNSEQIVSKYHNIHEYKDGILGFIDFLENNGGNTKKVLNMDKKVAENMKTILGGKSVKDATLDEIKTSLKSAMENKSKALDAIYDIFKSKDNKFIQRAKTCNSAFGFASTLVLVPAFMMWLARYCEKMTKERVAKEAEMKKAQEAAQSQPLTAEKQEPVSNPIAHQTIPNNLKTAQKLTMSVFLNK